MIRTSSMHKKDETSLFRHRVVVVVRIFIRSVVKKVVKKVNGLSFWRGRFVLSLNVCEVSRVISEHLHHPKFAQGKVFCRKQYFRASITTRQQAKVVIITKGIQKFSFMFACCASICYIFIFIFKSFIIHTLHHHMCHDYHTIWNWKPQNFQFRNNGTFFDNYHDGMSKRKIRATGKFMFLSVLNTFHTNYLLREIY